MTWTSRTKDIATTLVTPHSLTRAGVTGRAPGIATTRFTPAEFFGAGARCCHTHVVNPAAVTAESRMIKALVEPHVDDTSADFAILSSADNLKDYVKSYFSGTVGVAVAYLAMIDDGYVWSAHFEKLIGGNPSISRKPDYVFARPGQNDVALMESKGGRSGKRAKFDKKSVDDDGYRGQVEPHLGFTIGGSNATHGYSIGSWLRSPVKAELLIHHTDAVAATPTIPSSAQGTNGAVVRQNYATVCRLVHSELLSQQVLSGNIEDNDIPFIQFEWLGRHWLTFNFFWPERIYFDSIAIYERNRFFDLNTGYPLFAIERNVAASVLKAVVSPEPIGAFASISPLPPALREEARSQPGAAIFPDGLAVAFAGLRNAKGLSRVSWNWKEKNFS